jgi:hypothetical protein
MPPANVKRQCDSLSDRFELEETFLSSPNAAAIKSAVILRDRRRMNVLLSRAKWKLVIVGSMEFLRVQGRRYRRHKNGDRAVPAFLAKMLEVFDRLAGETLPDGKTPKFTIVPWASLTRDPSS